MTYIGKAGKVCLKCGRTGVHRESLCNQGSIYRDDSEKPKRRENPPKDGKK